MATSSHPSGLPLFLRRDKRSRELHTAIFNDHEISMICTKCKNDMSTSEIRNNTCTGNGKVGSGRTLRNRRTRRNKRTLRNRR